MGDDLVSGIANLANAFSERYLGEVGLEIELRTEVLNYPRDRRGNECNNTQVDIKRFYVCTYVNGRHCQTEVGDVSYDLYRCRGLGHRGVEEKVSDNIIEFISILCRNGIDAKITSDSTELFEDIGTLGGRSIREAVVDSCQHKHLRRQEQRYIGLTSNGADYLN